MHTNIQSNHDIAPKCTTINLGIVLTIYVMYKHFVQSVAYEIFYRSNNEHLV